MAFFLRGYAFIIATLVFSFPAKADIKSDVEKDFSRAQNLSREGHEAAAMQSWRDFIRRFPRDSRVDDAYFYLADLHQRQSDFESAINLYNKVFNYPGSNKAADAALALGVCYYALKNKTKAEIQWNAVLRRYPKTNAAKQARLLLQEKGPS